MTVTELPVRPPSPPLRLRRLYLSSVGPAAARFDPLMLDLRAPDGEAADKALLSLTNTGGKSTLLRLITSVVVPSARAQMGGANIGEYIQTGDTSHVVLEWERDDGTSFVVAGVYEWPNRQRPADATSAKPVRVWYTFRPTDAIGIEDLPFLDGERRRRRLDAYRRSLTELFTPHPEAMFAWTRENQTEWSELIETRTDLDPELFRYQMRMNDDEAGAEALVKELDTPDKFVKFFVDALNDGGALNDFSNTLTTYAHAAAKRGQWEREREFCDVLAEKLEVAATKAAAARQATGAVTLAATIAGEFAGALEARASAEAAAARAAELELEPIGARLEAANARSRTVSDVRAQLLLEQARFQAADAEDRFNDADRAVTQLERDRKVWDAVAALTADAKARETLNSARRAYDKAEQGLTPLREAATAASAGYVARLLSLAAEADREAGVQRGLAAGAEASRLAAVEAQTNAARRLGVARGQLSAIAEAATGAENAVKNARTSGLLHAGETAWEAIERLNGAVVRLEGERDRDREVGREAARLASQLRSDRKPVSLDADKAGWARQRAIDTRERYLTELTELSSVEAVASVVDGLLEGPGTATRAAVRLTERAVKAERTAANADTRLEVIHAEIDRLEGGDLMAGSPDAEEAAVTLNAARIGAVTGWAWLAVNVVNVDQRRRLIRSHPEVAGGVIVTDAARLPDAEIAITTATEAGVLTLRSALVITVPSALVNPTKSGDTARVVFEPHRAIFDPDWVPGRLDQLHGEREQLRGDVESSRVVADAARSAAASLSQFATTWPAEMVEGLDDAVTTAATKHKELTDKVAAIDTEVDELEVRRQKAEQAAAAAADQLSAVTAERERATQLVVAVVDGLDGEARRAAAVSDLDAAQKDADDGVAAHDDASSRFKAAVQAQQSATSSARQFCDTAADVGTPAALETPDQPLAVLKVAHIEHRKVLTAAEAGSTHAPALNDAEGRAADTAARLGQFAVTFVAEGRRLMQTLAAQTEASWHEEADRLGSKHMAAVKTRAQIEVQLEGFRRLVKERTPEGRLVHASLTEEWVPVDLEATTELLARADRETTALREEIRRLDARRGELETRRGDAQLASSQFESARSAWVEEPVPGQRPFDGAFNVARDEMRHRVQEHRRAGEMALAAEKDLAGTVDRVKDLVREERWPDAVIRTRCRQASSEELAERAAGWAGDLVLRSKTLAADIADLDEHRDMLVTTLVSLCESQLRLLRAVTKASILPPGLGSLSGEPAFKLGFERSNPVDARGALAVRVDNWALWVAGEEGRKVRPSKSNEWLAEAMRDMVRSTVGGGSPWRVKVLKPPVDGRVEHCTPGRVKTEYSGGQELTLAVLLYCTLAAVRAANRTGGERPPGILLLDNPFGKASNEALIEMQQRLAASSKVQLVCATALNDPGVLTAFEGPRAKVLRLRNDRDQRHGLQYLRVSDPTATERLTALVVRPDAEDPVHSEGRVAAAGYTIQTTPKRR